MSLQKISGNFSCFLWLYCQRIHHGWSGKSQGICFIVISVKPGSTVLHAFCVYRILSLMPVSGERSYDPSVFHNRVERVLIDDHNVPRLRLECLLP